jgi:4-amino-4-deoxy-L-arabinose transferase-like glycosyltransferase
MKRVLLALLLLHLLRLLLAPLFELAPQEAYYFLYSQHPALSYFDHPPAIAWLIAPFAAVLGRTELAPRLAAWTATLLTGLAFAALARRTLPRARRSWAVLVLGTTMLASFVGVVATPDVPLLLFWALSLLYLHRALFGGTRIDWILAGLFMGLAFDAKYTALFLQLGLFAFLVLSSRHRRWLTTAWPYLAILVAHLTAAPVYLWNARHGFASLLFQSAHRATLLHGIGWTNLAKLVGSQMFLLAPPLAGAVIWAAARAVPLCLRRVRRRPQTVLFLACFCLPLLGLCVALSLFTLVKSNWLMPAYLAGALLALRLLPDKALWKANLAFSGILLVATGLEAVLYLVPIQSDDTWYGWRQLAGEVARRAQADGAAFVFADDEYKTTAELRFYSDLPAYAGNVLGRPALQFDYLGEDLGALAGKDALFLDSRPGETGPEKAGQIPSDLVARFATVEEEEPILLRRRGVVVRKFLAWRCQGYRPLSRPLE